MPNDKPLTHTELQGPAKGFAEFCEAEFERLRNSDEPFDEEAYQEAMQLVLRKLQRPVD
jgi:hypothetical protein